jgi:WD40 repeat protein
MKSAAHPASPSTTKARLAMPDAAALSGIRTVGSKSPTIYSTAFSPNGKALVTADADGTVRLRNASTGRQINSLSTDDTIAGSFSVAFSPDGKTLASADADGTMQLWNVSTGVEIGTPSATGIGLIHSVTFSPDGETLASPLTTSVSNNSWVTVVAFSPDGLASAPGASNGRARRLANPGLSRGRGEPGSGELLLPGNQGRHRSHELSYWLFRCAA